MGLASCPSFSDGRLTLRPKPGRLSLKASFEDGLWTVEWEGCILGYAAGGRTLVEEVAQTLLFLWREYVLVPEEGLTLGAKALRRLLKRAFEASGD